MATNSGSTVIGVFRDQAMAKQALDDLRNAGFDRDQMRYSGSAAGGFLEDVKSLFKGPEATSDDFAKDLADLGLSNEEVQYYIDEHRRGNAIVAVQAPGREQEAMDILQRSGAYHSSMSPASVGTTPGPAPVGATPGPTPTRTTTYAQPQSGDTQLQEVQTQVQQAEAQLRAAKEREAQLQAEREQQTQWQATQAQLHDARRQLHEMQRQLHAAREREAQLRAAKERAVQQGQLVTGAPQGDVQFQETQRQLQEVQAQLRATQAELQATQQRIAQMER